MEPHQSVMMTNSSVVTEPPKQKPNSVVGFGVNNGKETVGGKSEGFVGVLEVYIHQARDIHNICIYHKQDVYAKLSMTSDPDTTVSTQIINGGGKNPVFNENLQINVGTISSSLKCEIWMLSRVRNYLEDQLLGFALVPLSDVIGNRKLAKEFSLSSTDLFHSPAGFVQLSISYNGASPEVLEVPSPPPPPPARSSSAGQESEIIPDSSLPSKYGMIEFPDPKLVNENQMMVSEYFGISCADLDSQSSESLGAADNDDHLSSDIGGYSTTSLDSIEVSKIETPPSSVSTNGSPSISIPESSQSVCDTPPGAPNQDVVSSLKEKIEDVGQAETESGSSAVPVDASVLPAISINIEAEQKVVHQEIVDMYMKSVQQFTESLAKMKLPMDIENGSTNSGNSGSDEKLQASKGNGSRVFYGSRAFF